MGQYGTLITSIGLAKIANAQITQTKVNLSHIALGDGNGGHYNPSQNQTSLVQEVWRGEIADVSISPTNPNRVVADAVIPATAGGFTIREVGLFDVDGDLIAVGQYPATYKPQLSEGIANDLLIHFTIETTNANVVNLAVDPTIIIASRQYVDQKTNKNATDLQAVDNKVNTHLAHETQHDFTENNGEISVDFRNKFFFIDSNNNVFYKPNGDGNAGSSLGEQGYINLWRVS